MKPDRKKYVVRKATQSEINDFKAEYPCCYSMKDRCPIHGTKPKQPSIDPKAFEVMCNDLFDKRLSHIVINRKELKSALKVYLKAERGI